MGAGVSISKYGLAVGLLLAIAGGPCVAQADNKYGNVPGGEQAKPLRQEKPRYPHKAENRGIEGWVLFSFTVEVDGSTSNLVLLDQSTPGYFEKEVFRVLKKWRYAPATLRGVPVVQSQRRVLIAFDFENWSPKASRRFIILYDKTIAALSAGNLEEADGYIHEIENLQRRNLYETKYLFALKSELAQKRGDVFEAAQQLKRALSFGDAPIEDESVWIMGKQLFMLEVQAGLLTDAIGTYKWLNKWRPFDQNSEIYRINEEILAYLNSEKPIAFNGRISDQCTNCSETFPLWLHDLHRKTFSFDRVEGQIDHFQLYCGYHWSQLDYEPEKSWKIDDDWGSCDIYVYGTEGTTFRLIERH